jgi:hypothetical protein
VLGRAGGRIVNEGSHGDVDKRAVAHHRVEQGAAHLAACVVAAFVADGHEFVAAAGDAQFVAFDAGKRFEGRTSRLPAVRTMAVCGIDELIRDCVTDDAALAPSTEEAVTCAFLACH